MQHDAPTYEIVLAYTGDRAEATTPAGALLAAATLVDDDLATTPTQGRMRALRDTLYVHENGSYSGTLTTWARAGRRTP